MAQAVRPKVNNLTANHAQQKGHKNEVNKPKTAPEKITQALVTAQSQTHPVTKTQSLVLVKDLVSASFGSLAFLRGLFEDNNFNDDFFHAPKNDDIPSKDSTKKKKKALHVKRLKPGVTEEADTLLEWIEKGVYDALENKYLQNIIFSIFSSPENELDSFEVYTFSFSYTSDNQVQMDIGSNRSEFDSSSVGSYDDALRNFYRVVHKFILVTQSVGKMPNDRYLSMRLLYTPDTPKDYQPPKFQDCTGSHEASNLLQRVDESKYVTPAGKANLGDYSISLKVVTKHMKPSNHSRLQSKNIRESQDQESVRPNNQTLPNSQSTSEKVDNTQPTEEVPNQGDLKRPSQPSHLPKRGQAVERGPTLSSFSKPDGSSDLNGEKDPDKRITKRNDTETESQLHLKNELYGMFSKEPVDDNMAPTQPLGLEQSLKTDSKGSRKGSKAVSFKDMSTSKSIATSSSDLSDISDSEDGGSVSVGHIRSSSIHDEILPSNDKPPAKRRKTNSSGQGTVAPVPTNKKESNGNLSRIETQNEDELCFNDEFVDYSNDKNHRCFCNQYSESVMIWICCDTCKKWAHAYCEGYFMNSKFSDPRIDKTNYKCLHCQILENAQSEENSVSIQKTYNEMKRIAILRKVLGHIWECAHSNTSAMDQYEYDNSSNVNKVCEDLSISIGQFKRAVGTFAEEKLFLPVTDMEEPTNRSKARKYAPRGKKIRSLMDKYFIPVPALLDNNQRKKYHKEITVLSSTGFRNKI